jgi:amino acid transporter
MALSDMLFGRMLASDEEGEQRVGVLAGIPMLGLDALGSAAYGPEAALTLLIPLGAAGLWYVGPISALIIILLLVVYFSYRQTIAAYPHGGGSYTVAKDNLGTTAGLLAAAALILDYVLVVAVGISAGVGALISAVPALHPYPLHLCLAILALITLINLRGVRESGLAFAVPTYLFVFSLLTVLLLGTVRALLAGGRPEAMAASPTETDGSTAPVVATWWLLMRSFASGCTAMTGVEAVSNGVCAFREPAVCHARRTLTAIIALLAIMLAGIAYLCWVYGIEARDENQPNYDSILSQLTAAVVGQGWFYYLTIGAVLSVLALSANTGFADFPRLCRVIAQDGFLPNSFAHRGRRLVYSRGILVLAALAAVPPDRVRRYHRQADSLVCRGRVPCVHSLAGRDGGALAKSRWAARAEIDADQWSGCDLHGGNSGRGAGFQVYRRRLGHDPAHPGAADLIRRRPRALPVGGA